MPCHLSPQELGALGAELSAAMLKAAEDYLVKIASEEVRGHFRHALQQISRAGEEIPGTLQATAMADGAAAETTPLGLTQ